MTSRTEIDARQWLVTRDGPYSMVVSLSNTGRYRILTRILPKCLKICDAAKCNEALAMDPDKPVCKCPGRGHPSCQNLFGRGQIFVLRMKWFENYPNGKEWLTNILRLQNADQIQRYATEGENKKPQIHYFLQEQRVCRNFFEVAYALDHRVVDDIAAMVLGLAERPRQEEKRTLHTVIPAFERGFPQTSIAYAFWKDFFSLCQIPNADERIFPSSQPYQLIYACRFVPWWEVTQGHVPPPPPKPDNPLAAVPEVAAVVYSDACLDHKHDEDNGDPPPVEQPLPDLNDRKEAVARDPHGVAHATPSVAHATAGDRDDCLVDDRYGGEDFGAYCINGRPYGMKVPEGCPSFTTFYLARFHDDFKDVTKRPKHHHVRCKTCAEHHDVLLDQWQKRKDLTPIKSKIDEHAADVRAWRDYECYWHNKAVYSPAEVVVLSYDDTSALGMPRLTNRDIKNFCKTRVDVIPFNLTNQGPKEEFYYYTLQGQFKKGANRLCTTLWHALQRIKHRPAVTPAEQGQKLARRLVLIADNYSENKNNTLMAFLSLLIYMKEFDCVELYFGPVGHTHNGGDVNHGVHNNIVGDHESVALPEFFQAYRAGWRNDKTRPQPIIVDVQYDWDGYFLGNIRPVSYMNGVRAIKLERGPAGFIEVHMKATPQSKDWCGQGGLPNAPGFTLLRHVPQCVPKTIAPRPLKLHVDTIKFLHGKNLRSYCEVIGKTEQLQWTQSMAELGHIPPGQPITDADIRSQFPKLLGWENLERIGKRGWTVVIPFLREKQCRTIEEFFSTTVYPHVDIDLTLEPAESGASGVACATDPVAHATPSNTPMSVVYSNEAANARAREKRKKRKEKATQDDDDESQNTPSYTPSPSLSTWSSWPLFSLCQKGIFAVVKIDYSGVGGISVQKVVEVSEADEGFTGFEWTPFSVYTSPNCIK